MPNIKLEVVPKPKEGTRIVLKLLATPGFSGEGDYDLLCGSCEKVLAEKIVYGHLQEVVLHCPKCDTHNEVQFRKYKVYPHFSQIGTRF